MPLSYYQVWLMIYSFRSAFLLRTSGSVMITQQQRSKAALSSLYTIRDQACAWVCSASLGCYCPSPVLKLGLQLIEIFFPPLVESFHSVFLKSYQLKFIFFIKNKASKNLKTFQIKLFGFLARKWKVQAVWKMAFFSLTKIMFWHRDSDLFLE